MWLGRPRELIPRRREATIGQMPPARAFGGRDPRRGKWWRHATECQYEGFKCPRKSRFRPSVRAPREICDQRHRVSDCDIAACDFRVYEITLAVAHQPGCGRRRRRVASSAVGPLSAIAADGHGRPWSMPGVPQPCPAVQGRRVDRAAARARDALRDWCAWRVLRSATLSRSGVV